MSSHSQSSQHNESAASGGATRGSGRGRGGGRGVGAGRGVSFGDRAAASSTTARASNTTEGMNAEWGLQLRNEVQIIMENVVTKFLVQHYANGIVNLFIWIFDSEHLRAVLFKDWFLADLINGNAIDQSLPTTKKRHA